MAIKVHATQGGGEGGEEGQIVAEINITPLVDVFLVLLIIFMVTSSVMSQMGVDVQLPHSSAATSQSQAEGVIITLLPGGRLKVNETDIPAGRYSEMEGALKKAFSQTQSRLAIIEGDRQAFLGSAIEVMDHARKAGADRFAIATSPDKE